MKTFPAACACVLAALVLAGAASAGTVFGVTEDAAKYSSDGGASVFSAMRDIGMTENAVSVQWDPTRPGTIVEKRLLDRMVPIATAHGVRIVFTVYPTRAAAITSSAAAASQFASFLQLLARTYPQVKDFVVGNEPNYGRFWQPQLNGVGSRVAGAAYEALLARSYDALKAVNPAIDVIGLGLAARGNGQTSTSPVLFIHDVGAAYRQSGRRRPLMDALAYHPYPASSHDTELKSQLWPNAGVEDLARIKQAVWDAFDGTAQPTFETGLELKITEIGWQVRIPPAEAGAYQGRENVPTTNESIQADLYSEVVSQMACDPAVSDLLFFHLVDEPQLSGFQSGLIRADGTRRPSYFAVKNQIAQLAGGCQGQTVQWHHATNVVGAQVDFAGAADAQPTFSVSTGEDAAYVVELFSVGSDGSYTAVGPSATTGDARATQSLTSEGSAHAGRSTRGSLPSVALGPGTYIEAVKLAALMNPQRTSTFVSRPFTIAPPAPPATTAETPAATQPTATAPQPTAPAPVTAQSAPSAPPAAPTLSGEAGAAAPAEVTLLFTRNPLAASPSRHAKARPKPMPTAKPARHGGFSAKWHDPKLPPAPKGEVIYAAPQPPAPAAAAQPVAAPATQGSGRTLALLFGVPLALAGVVIAVRVALRTLV